MTKKKGGRFSLLKLINFFLVLVIVGRIGYLYAQRALDQIFNAGEVMVPELVGLRLTDALKVVDKFEMKISVKGEEYDNIAPKDCIAVQEPKPGMRVKKGRTIDVVISKGAESYMVPDLTGLRYTQGVLAIRNSGLLPGKKTYIHHSTIDIDHIIAQAPEKGFMVNRTEPIDLLVSMGKKPEYVVLPDFVNGKFTVVRTILADLDLELAKPQFENDTKKSVGIILKQEPPAGSRVRKGSTVKFVVNRELGEKYSPQKRFKEVVFIVPESLMDQEIRMILYDESGFREVYRRVHPSNDIIRLPVGGYGEMRVAISLDGILFKEEML